MKDTETTLKLTQALRLLAECGCTIEHHRTRDSLLHVSVPNSVDRNSIDEICDAVEIMSQSKISPNDLTLTPQQTEVLHRISAAKPNKQIAYELGISITTVKAHATNIYRRIGVRNRAEALLFTQRQRLELAKSEQLM